MFLKIYTTIIKKELDIGLYNYLKKGMKDIILTKQSIFKEILIK